MSKFDLNNLKYTKAREIANAVIKFFKDFYEVEDLEFLPPKNKVVIYIFRRHLYEDEIEQIIDLLKKFGEIQEVKRVNNKILIKLKADRLYRIRIGFVYSEGTICPPNVYEVDLCYVDQIPTTAIAIKPLFET